MKQQFQERTMANIQFVVFGVMIGTLALVAGCPLPCLFLNDGECDDGRADAVTDLCPLGTDPEDCGPVPQPPPSKCDPNQIDIVPKIAGSLTDFTWKVTTTCAGPLNGIVCFEGGNESLCSANILDTPTINSMLVTNLTSSFAVDFLLPSGAERVSLLYCDSSTLSLITPHTCSDGSSPQTKTVTVGRQEPPPPLPPPPPPPEGECPSDSLAGTFLVSSTFLGNPRREVNWVNSCARDVIALGCFTGATFGSLQCAAGGIEATPGADVFTSQVVPANSTRREPLKFATDATGIDIALCTSPQAPAPSPPYICQ